MSERNLVTEQAFRAGPPPAKAGGIGGTLARAALAARGLVALRRPPPADPELAAQTRPRTWPSFYLLSFLACVVLPSLVSILYLAFIASNQYVAEARFAVQAAQFGVGEAQKAEGASSGLSIGGLPALTGQDAYVITNYIHSRAILDDLKGKIDIRAIYRRPQADFWARLKRNAKAEDLLAYWNSMVSTYIDGPSGIVTLRVRAFRPDDARALAQAILQASEKLANDMSENARESLMREAESEMRRSQAMVTQALDAERSFQDREGYINPVTAATSTSTLLLQTMAEKIKLAGDYDVAERTMSASAPAALQLKAQLDALDAQIAKLKDQLTSTSDRGRTIAASLVTFQKLELNRIFAEKLYSLAQEALERARMNADDQDVFVSVFVPPDRPQEATYPQRLSLSLLIPIGFLIVWGIFALIAAAIEDHRY